MDGTESSSYTVLQKLQVRDLIKKVASKLLVTINRRHSKDVYSEFNRYAKIKQLIELFRDLRRKYKTILEPNF